MAFQTLVSKRREAVDSALRVHNYCVDCEETSKWITDKTKVVESTKDLGRDLAGVIAIQRKLSGLERDVAAIQARVDALERESQQLMDSHPEQKEDIGQRQKHLEELWQGLQQALQGQEASLGEASQLQAFLQDLDDFGAWLSIAQKAVASEDMPESLPEAEQLLQQHAAIKDEIDGHQDSYQRVKESGEKVIRGQTDPEYLLLGQRLEGLDTGWDALDRMWESRSRTLAQCLGFQEFQKDAKQAEAILSNQGARSYRGLCGCTWCSRLAGVLITSSVCLHALSGNLLQQEYTLAHLEPPDSLEAAEAGIRKFEDFLVSMENNRDKVLSPVDSGNKLVAEGNLYSDKIKEKVQLIEDRYSRAPGPQDPQSHAGHRKNAEKAQEATVLLRDNLELQNFLQNCQEKQSALEAGSPQELFLAQGLWDSMSGDLRLTLWINDKLLTSQDVSYDEARNLHNKWLKHQAFVAELASYEGWLENIDAEGKQLMEEKPQFAALVSERLKALHLLWDELQATTKEKTQRLSAARSSDLRLQTHADLNKWISAMEDQLRSDDPGKDLTSVNRMLAKLKAREWVRVEDQVNVRKEELGELFAQVPSMGEEAGDTDSSIEKRFLDLLEPLGRRKKQLESSRAKLQISRDLEDETLWVEERLPLAQSADYGTNLQTVQLFMKKNQVSPASPCQPHPLLPNPT
ncbi:hypothetical protein P7K49_018197 [Saguinus oedipus]|uniref:Uncharacterized protein n=1 Tax=Saguinus oedipus TaxID=9490 RepID=A0ABQ9V525_SAGOE|nr:hypothetical protein P7K49_018197 [Saguinus oedipus]